MGYFAKMYLISKDVNRWDIYEDVSNF